MPWHPIFQHELLCSYLGFFLAAHILLADASGVPTTSPWL